MYMGRVAVEKTSGVFLAVNLPGTKCVIGDGPALKDLRRRYPQTLFPGYKFGKALLKDRGRCCEEALKHTWAESSRQFSEDLVPTG